MNRIQRYRWTTILFFFLSSIFVSTVWNSAAQAVQDSEGKQDDGVVTILFSGGWIGVGILIALMSLSLLAVYLIVDQAILLRAKNIVPKDLGESVRNLLAQGKAKEADSQCRNQPCPLALVLIHGISELEFGWPAVEKAIEETLAEQAARLYRKVEYLSVIGNIAPMLGLLGTVTGMIMAFRQVAISEGTAGAGELAQGIYSALVTTVAGLVIAIPSLAAFAVFRNRIDELIADAAYSAQHAFSPIRHRIARTVVRSATSRTPGT